LEKHDASGWPESFAPRSDLLAAESVPEIKRKHLARRAGKFDDLDDFSRRLLAQTSS
jgi:hypothetical protein